MTGPATAAVWGAATAALAAVFYGVTVRAVPYIVAWRALAGMRRRGYPVNTLVHRGLNTAENCRTPLSVADALISVCRYDVSAGSLVIDLTVPAEGYWSLACYRRRTDNFAMLSDRDVRATGSRRAVLVLGQTTVSAAAGLPVFHIIPPDRKGLLIVRLVVSDPADTASVQAAMAVQEASVVRNAAVSQSADLLAAHVTLAGGERYCQRGTPEELQTFLASQFGSAAVQAIEVSRRMSLPGGASVMVQPAKYESGSADVG